MISLPFCKIQHKFFLAKTARDTALFLKLVLLPNFSSGSILIIIQDSIVTNPAQQGRKGRSFNYNQKLYPLLCLSTVSDLRNLSCVITIQIHYVEINVDAICCHLSATVWIVAYSLISFKDWNDNGELAAIAM